MAKMSLNSITLEMNPSEFTMPRPKRYVAWKPTYSSIGFFSWGTLIAGVEISLKWPFMTTSQFATLDTIYKADAAVVWNPQDGTSKTFNVEVADLSADYHIKLDNAAGNFRKNVEMLLVILSEV
jgi:hypothetical protein